MRRSLLPHLVLGLLTVLVAGAIALGLVLAPKTPNLVVHNGAGELTYADRLTVVLSSPASSQVEVVDYRSPQTAIVTLQSGSSVLRRSVVHSPEVPVQVFGPFRELQNVNNFTAGTNDRFYGSFPASDVVPANERAVIRGTIFARATVRGGYVVRLGLGGTIGTSAGSNVVAQTYCVRQINGTRIQAC